MQVSVPDDDTLLDAFREGQADAVHTVRGWVLAVVRGGNWRFSDAEGVAQEILLVLTRRARDGKITERSRFRSFVYTVARRTCVDVYHRERRGRGVELPQSDEPQHEPADSRADPGADVERREQLDLALLVVQKLPEACRELWRLVYLEGRTASEVGETLGITAGNVRVRVHRCLEKARAFFKEATGHA